MQSRIKSRLYPNLKIKDYLPPLFVIPDLIRDLTLIAVFKSQYHALIPMTDALYQAEVLYYLEHGVYTDEFNKLDIGIYKDEKNETAIHRGSCRIELSSKYVYCHNPTLKFSYLRAFSGRRYCVVYDNNAKSHQLCQDETKKTESPNGAWYAY